MSGLLSGSLIPSSARTAIWARARRSAQVLVRKLLDQAIGAIIVPHARLVGRLRGLQIVLILLLGVLSLLGRIWVIRKVSLAICSLRIHILLTSLRLVDWLRERGGSSGISAIVGGRIEGTIVVPEVQVETVAISIHLDSSSGVAEDEG